MAYTTPGTPNVADYTTFLQAQGFTATILPTASPYIQWSYDWAVQYVGVELMSAAQFIAVQAIYNLGASFLIAIAPDQTGQNAFKLLRQKYGIVGKGFGILSNASDQGTSAGYMIPESLQGLTLQDIEHLKNPYGQYYEEFVQNYGSNLWGLT